MLRKLGIAWFLLALAACQTLDHRPYDSDVAGDYYQVKPGDSVSKIAAKKGIKQSEILEANGITDHRALKIGQWLYLPDPDPIGAKIAQVQSRKPKPRRAAGKVAAAKQKPATKPSVAEAKAAHQPIFTFPVPAGRIFKEYSKDKKEPYDGLGIAAARGQSVIAAAPGQVLFAGDDGTRYGLLVIIEHAEPYITVYTHLDRALVKTGQKVANAQAIGTVGISGGAKTPQLHFQVRVSQKPQNPRNYLKKVG
jgi:murein DD-endopeptidase MepM/ murein hydrolase activator NlpD